MFVLLAAANRKQQQHNCRQVVVNIKGEKFYVDKADILKALQSGVHGSLIHKPVTAFDLSVLEKKLEDQSWIRDAELYFDSKDVLHVWVSEREPIARVFTAAGTTFYIDSAGKRLPLLNKLSARVPVVTNFIAAKRLNGGDSILLKEVTDLVQYISGDDFWKAQIAQIDITPAHTFELIPVVGNHIIRLGSAKDYKEKLQRLFVFYQQVLSKTGFDKYAVLDVQFDGQVVASQKSSATGIDSLQLQKNIEELVAKTKLQAFNDSIAIVQKEEAIKEAALAKQEPLVVKPSVTDKAVTNKAIVKKKVAAVKAKPPAKVVVKQKVVKKPVKQQPKAVMKRTNEY
jgi:cell division protein FtsQ